MSELLLAPPLLVPMMAHERRPLARMSELSLAPTSQHLQRPLANALGLASVLRLAPRSEKMLATSLGPSLGES